MYSNKKLEQCHQSVLMYIFKCNVLEVSIFSDQLTAIKGREHLTT